MKALPKSSIEYLTHHWPVVTGCSFGCPWCWARKNAAMRPACHTTGRLGGEPYPFARPLCHPDRLDLPLLRKKPARIGVCFTGDLFATDDEVSHEFKRDVFHFMDLSRQHKFFLLTKRASMMRHAFEYFAPSGDYPHVWAGVSVTNQQEADERIPLLLATPAARRWVSIEPMLGTVDLDYAGFDGGEAFGARRLDFVVCGSIDRPTAQHPAPKREWIDAIVEQCKAAGVPVWVKNNVRKLYPEARNAWPQELPA